MGNGGYYPYFADPGELAFKMKVKTDLLHFSLMHFRLEKEKAVLKINVDAGKTYYVKHRWDSQATFSNLAVMELVNNEVGAREIVKCKKAKDFEY